MEVPTISQSSTAYSWSEAKRLARKNKYGTKIRISKSNVFRPPSGFKQSFWSIRNGANAVYRDQRKTDSFQIREFDDHYTIEMDRHNPETGDAISHAVQDAPKYTIAAGAVLASILSSG